MKNGYAEFGNAKIYYEVRGDGEPLILVNGNGLDLEMWNPQIEVLAREFRIIRYDLRGIGKSSAPDETFSHSEDIYNLLKFLGVEKAHVVALSFGGAFAIDFAFEHSETVKSLTLAAAITSDFRDEYLEGLCSLSQIAKEKGTAEAIETLVQIPTFIAPENTKTIEETRDNFLRNARAFETDFPAIRLWRPPQVSIDEMLAAINSPVLIIVGEKDDVSIHDIADKLQDRIKNAQKITIKNAAHIINLEKPKEFNSATVDFLRENLSN